MAYADDLALVAGDLVVAEIYGGGLYKEDRPMEGWMLVTLAGEKVHLTLES